MFKHISNKKTEIRNMMIQHIVKITHIKITHYIDNTKNNANKCSNACCTFTGFPTCYQETR